MIPPPIGISEMNATYAATWYTPKKPACSVFYSTSARGGCDRLRYTTRSCYRG